MGPVRHILVTSAVRRAAMMAFVFRGLRSVLEVVGGRRRAGPPVVDVGAALIHVGQAVGSQVRAVVRVAAARSLAPPTPEAPPLALVPAACSVVIESPPSAARGDAEAKPKKPKKPRTAKTARTPEKNEKRKNDHMSDKNKQEVSFEGALPVDRIVSYLRELADGFEKGEVPVERGVERVTLVPSDHIDIEVKAKVKKRKHQLRLELEWEEPERSPELKIG